MKLPKGMMGVLAAFAAMTAVDSTSNPRKGQKKQGSFGDIPSRAVRSDVQRPKGTKEYYIEGETIIAINKKNAIRKYNNNHKHEKGFIPIEPDYLG